MNKKTMLLTMSFITIILGSLACSFVSGLIDQGQGAISTAQSVATLAQNIATDIGMGEGLLGTAEAVATDLDAGDLGATAEAFATQIDTADLLSTAQALVPEIDLDEFLLTAQAVETEVAGGGGDPNATAQAEATQPAANIGDIPDDIPVPEGDLSNLLISPHFISFTINQPFGAILEFYEVEMAANGWSPIDDAGYISPVAAQLIYQKVDQTATMIISGLEDGNLTLVQIILETE